MIEYVFSPEMMYEREKQLILALSDCAGAYCDINFTQDRIFGTAIQIIDGEACSIHKQIGRPENSSYAEMIRYWGERIDPAEQPAFFSFFDSARIKECYANGERQLEHRYWIKNAFGKPMLTVQKILLYEDCVTGDLLGLTYVSNEHVFKATQKKAAELSELYQEASHRAAVLQKASHNVPGAYHRCGNGEGYPFLFVSKSFEKLVGYTKKQLRTELDNKFIRLVIPEDLPRFAKLEAEISDHGSGNVAYRIRRRDGQIRWVQDSTMAVDWDGEPGYQCTIADITDFVNQQEEFARQKMEFDLIAENIPCGYHRCTVDDGFRLEFVSESFMETMGYDRDELMGKPFLEFVVPEDREFFMSHEPELAREGKVELVYRIRRKDGRIRWIKDSTMRIQYNGKDSYQCILADITEHVETLNEAREQAEASSQAKSTFLFNASHDIRTPMNAIKGFAHIIQENQENPEIIADAVGKIQKATDTLMTLMNDVLELSRIEQGKEEINTEVVDLYENGRNLYEMFASEMQEAGIQFLPEGDELHDRVICDGLKLTRIVMNMLSNAKKFTPAGGTVAFGGNRLRSNGDMTTYRFFVRDTGVGMSKEFQKRAFQQFERERTSTESRISGSGLGLAIIKQLVDLMGGEVSIESELGKGTEISVILTFPMAKGKEERQPLETETVDMSGKRILLVEDNDFNREIARYLLESMQVVVEEAENGAVCVETLLNAEPGYYDLILMDLQMPIMDGYTASAEIRNLPDPQRAGTPIIAMTANAFEEDKRRCLAAGMNGHIGKPIDLEVLSRELAKIL